MRWILSVLLVLFAAVAVALLLMFNHGNVAIFFPPYRVDLSINTAVVLLLVLVLGLVFLIRAYRQITSLPWRLKQHRDQRYRERALQAFRDATVALADGRFARAEKQAQLALHLPEQGGPAALIGARACHGLRASERRDSWIRRCAEEFGLREQAWLLAADCAVDERDGEAALRALDRLSPKTARQVHALRLRLAALDLTQQWKPLLPVLAQLERRQMVSPQSAQTMRSRAWRNLLTQAGSDPVEVKAVWRQIPREMSLEAPVAEVAVDAFRRSGDFSKAAQVVEGLMRQRYSARAVDQYAAFAHLTPKEKLQTMEQWLKAWGEEASLLSALGRVCTEEQLWGKAESYLRESLKRDDIPATRLVLARLLEQTARMEEAAGLYRQAAHQPRPAASMSPGTAPFEGSTSLVAGPGALAGASRGLASGSAGSAPQGLVSSANG
jgi:HemY protein